MTNITNLTETFWNEFVGTRGAVNCSLDISSDGAVLLSCENHNKLFNTDTYSDIPEYVKTLAYDVQSVEFLTNIDRFPAWRMLLQQVSQLVKSGGNIHLSLNLDGYFADFDDCTKRTEQNFSELVDDFFGLGVATIDYQPYMEFLDKKTIAGICNSSEINEDEWIRIISWVGENNNLSEFVRFLHEHFYLALPPTFANHVWLKLCNRDTLTETQAVDVQSLALSDNPEFKSQLNKHLQHIPCAVMWHRLSTYMQHVLGLDTQAYLSDDMSQLFGKWARQPRLDEQALSIAKEWFKTPAISEALEFNGVPMGDCFVYELTSDVLEFCLHVREDQTL